ncbi:MAG: maltose ABC transporter substrate-binding protein [Defluviitaleaceae bacterium]|nr:maltose ABC transporter substrate-binding protein [Defluviitaleaceae bacterium]
MKKYLLPLMLVAALFVVGACGNGDDDQVTLTVWESLAGPDEFIQEAGRRFTEIHPHITIEFVNVEIGDAANQIALDGPAGVGPDLFGAPHDTLGNLVVGGHILPTSNANQVAGQVMESAVLATTFDGRMYGYPIASETYALFYNRALITSADVPRTFNDLVTFSLGFNAANPGMNGFVLDVSSAYYTIIFTTAGGNRLFGPTGADMTNSYINSPAAVQGMYFFQSLREILDVPAGDMNTAFADAAFASGNAAMHLTGPWNIAPFREAGLDFGVTTIPAMPGEANPPASFAGTRVMFVSAYSENYEEAQMFAHFLISAEMQQLRYDITGALPSMPLELDDAHLNGILAQLEYAFPMPSVPGMAAFWDAMGAASSLIWDGQDVQSNLDLANTAMVGN